MGHRARGKQEQIVDMLADGVPWRKIADALRVSEHTISIAARSVGICGKRNSKSRSIRIRRERVARLARRGYSAEKMADELRVSVKTVRNDLHALGASAMDLYNQRRQMQKDSRRARVAELRSSGLSATAVAKRLGVSRRTVLTDWTAANHEKHTETKARNR